jgi:uncharacterized membrane protein
MSKERALQAVLAVSLVGAAFSGTLVYREACSAAGGGCAAGGAPGAILGLPACVYGLFMYLVLVTLSALGLRSRR